VTHACTNNENYVDPVR